jgi:Fe-S oxidoreductase
MAKFDDALRGYARRVLERDRFRCRYCGLDGTQSFSNWLALSWDHLLPKGHPKRDDEDYIVVACSFCNTADNRYLEKAEASGFVFDDRTPDELVELRRKAVQATRDSYLEFWQTNVRGGEAGGSAT